MRPTDAVPRVQFASIYWMLMLNAVGVSTLLSLLPSVARAARIPDMLIILAQALSAATWVFVSKFWSRMSARHGHRHVMLIGAAGSCLATAATGFAIVIGVDRLVPPMIALATLIVGRAAYGGVGLASAPAAQAFVVERTPPARRTGVLASLASAQGLGMIVGPAMAPALMLVPSLGLGSPMFVIAAVMLASIPLILLLPGAGGGARGEGARAASASLWRMPNVRRLLLYSALTALAMSATTQTIGFLVIDTLATTPMEATVWIGRVLLAAAAATLTMQIAVIPLVKPRPRSLMIAGPVLAILACAAFATLPPYAAMVAASAVLNAGLALARPGVSAAASLALPLDRQQEVAGAILSTISAGIVVGPVLGLGLYGLWRPLPFVVVALLLAAALAVMWRVPDQPVEVVSDPDAVEEGAVAMP